MIRGLDYAQYTTVTNAQAMVNQQEQVDVVYIRARDGFRDDPKYKAHEAQIAKATNAAGAVLWGPYMYLNYAPGAPEGDDQAEDVYALTTGGGRLWQLPIAVDAERSTSGPLPAVKTYFDTLLVPAIHTLMARMGRAPVLYSNPDFLLNYAKSLLIQKEYRDLLSQCPLWLANYSYTAEPAYWPSIKALGVWDQWLIWQHKPSVSDWPGVSNVDLNRCQGTRAQWKAWIADAAKIPVEGGEDPVDPPPPVEDPVEDPALVARVEKLEKILAYHMLKGA